jgi:hypothetical protein
VCIVTLGTMAKLWSQLSHLAINRWIKKMWHTHMVEYYSARKKNEIMPFAGKWMELEIVMLSEVSRAQKHKYCMSFLMCKC